MASKVTVSQLSDEMLDTLYTEVVAEVTKRNRQTKDAQEAVAVHVHKVENMLVRFHGMAIEDAQKKIKELLQKCDGNTKGLLCWSPYEIAADLALPPKQANEFIRKNYKKHMGNSK